MDDQITNNVATEQPVPPVPPVGPAPTPQPSYNPTQPVVPVAPVANQSPRSYLAVVVLAFFAGQLGLARWYRGDASGKIRFWIAIACTLTAWIPLINVISALGLLVLTVWGIVDFFALHKTTTDANNQPYTASARDITWAKSLKTYYVVVISLVAAIFVIGIIAGILGVFKAPTITTTTTTTTTPYDSSIVTN